MLKRSVIAGNIARDSRDVGLSEYYSQRKSERIGGHYPIEEFVRRFLAGESCGYGGRGEHAYAQD